jgi:hypothetical protein
VIERASEPSIAVTPRQQRCLSSGTVLEVLGVLEVRGVLEVLGVLEVPRVLEVLWVTS